jgi:hypothetical protein
VNNPNFAKVIMGTKNSWAKGKEKVISELKQSTKDPTRRTNRLDVQTQMRLQAHQIEIPDTAEGIDFLIYSHRIPETELVVFLFKLFMAYGVVSYGMVSQRVKAEVVAGRFQQTVPKLIQKCLPILAVGLGNNVWCLKSCGNGDIDIYRDIVVSLFKESVSLNKNQIEQASINHLGKAIPTNIYDKIMRELAYRPGGAVTKWILKSGNLNNSETGTPTTTTS